MRPLGVVVGAAALFALLTPRAALAKRAAPAEVPPVVLGGVRYEAPHFDNPCGQKGGCVVAFDVVTGAQLWFVKVYCVAYDKNLEEDVQDVFITSMMAGGPGLAITNERDHRFSLDLQTRAVTGDVLGCEHTNLGQGSMSGGCSYGTRPAGATLWILAAMVVLGLVARRSPAGVGRSATAHCAQSPSAPAPEKWISPNRP
jgi:hypothetical protein